MSASASDCGVDPDVYSKLKGAGEMIEAHPGRPTNRLNDEDLTCGVSNAVWFILKKGVLKINYTFP